MLELEGTVSSAAFKQYEGYKEKVYQGIRWIDHGALAGLHEATRAFPVQTRRPLEPFVALRQHQNDDLNQPMFHNATSSAGFGGAAALNLCEDVATEPWVKVTKSQKLYMRSFFAGYAALKEDEEEAFIMELGKKWLVRYPVPVVFQSNPRERESMEQVYIEFVERLFCRKAGHYISQPWRQEREMATGMFSEQSDTDGESCYRSDDATYPIYKHSHIASSPLPGSSPITWSSPSASPSPVKPSQVPHSKRARSPESPLKKNGRSRLA
ncbi:hypothetical protein C8J56DRAFT_889870 [Mycena floridula]|nr:hypothetical protein C8J56DRAFT_889870 [Mycena floridula]